MDPVILPRSEHPISRAHIDKDALKVLYRLHQAGYLAYLVGGSVRDLLLGRLPKDFDVVTNARPNQIKQLFRNAFMVGRRFRLVHVIFGNKYIETSTFRQQPQEECGDESGEECGESVDLLMRRENVFGSPYEDATRRDFTINGLFYNIADYSVIDYVGGLEDLKARTLRSIGDPRIRFQEDPVRMIRAVRICGRTGFSFAPDIADAIRLYRDQILRCAKARNLEEIFQLLRYSAAEPSIRIMRDIGLMDVLIPEILPTWTDPEKEKRASRILKALDDTKNTSFPLSPSLLLAAVFLPTIEDATAGFQSGEDLRVRVESILEPFSHRFQLPRRFFDRITQICIAQRWFHVKKHKRFRPTSFVKRNFFEETLALASLYLPAEDNQWESNRDKWRSRILSAELPAEEQDRLLRLLQFTTRTRKRHRRPRVSPRPDRPLNDLRTQESPL